MTALRLLARAVPFVPKRATDLLAAYEPHRGRIRAHAVRGDRASAARILGGAGRACAATTSIARARSSPRGSRDSSSRVARVRSACVRRASCFDRSLRFAKSPKQRGSSSSRASRSIERDDDVLAAGGRGPDRPRRNCQALSPRQRARPDRRRRQARADRRAADVVPRRLAPRATGRDRAWRICSST